MTFKILTTATLCAMAFGLIGCASNLPSLKLMSETGQSKQQAIMQQVYCELSRANFEHGRALSAQSYKISVLLSLTVDDSIGSTPSVGYTEANKADTSLGVSLGGEYSRGRKRTYTSSYIFDASRFGDGLPGECTPDLGRGALASDLGLNEIVWTGLNAQAANDGKLIDNNTGDGKTAPNFGSQVQFVTTKSVSPLGVTWTLHKYKFPGNVLTLKRTDTDSVTLGFAPAPTLPKSLTGPDTRAGKNLLSAKARKVETDAALEAAKSALESHKSANKNWSSSSKQEARTSALEMMAAQAKREADQAQRDLDLAEDQVAALEGRDEQRQRQADEAAASSARDAVTTILLQNLQPR